MSEDTKQGIVERISPDQAANRLIGIHAAAAELTSSPSVHDALELALATVLTSRWMGGKDVQPVWLMIVGNPSSGKTEVVLACKKLAEHVLYVDTLTENAFGSGFVDDKQKSKYRAKNQDLLGELQNMNRALIIKDLTTLFSLRDDKLKKILGDLTSIYDGSYSKWTGTLGQIKYEVKFPMLACITPEVLRKHHNYMSQIGGRFLMFRLTPLSEGEQEEGFEILWNEKQREKNIRKLQRDIASHIEQILAVPVELEEESGEVRDTINRLAMILARGRGIVIRQPKQMIDEQTGAQRHSYEVVDTQVEGPFRIFQQLRLLGRALTVVHGRAKVSDHELELLRRVVFSSIPPDRARILNLFVESPAGFSALHCAQRLGLSRPWAKSVLDEMVLLKVLTAEIAQGETIYKPLPGFTDLVCRPIAPLDHMFDLSTAPLGGAMKQNSPLTNSNILIKGGSFVSSNLREVRA